MRNEIKSFVVDNTIDKPFGCAECDKDESHIVIEDMTLFVDGVNELFTKKASDLLYEYWQSSSDACPLECGEAEKQESGFKKFVESKFR